MRIERTIRCLTLLSLLAAAAAVPPAKAQSYPARPVRMIVPYPPGGGTDTISRLVAQKLSERWGQQVVVDNRSGAAGIIGTELTARSNPDGYTMAVVIATHASNPALYPKLPYDTLRDFVPVTLMAQYPYILTVHPSVPAKTASEFIALAKQKPGAMSYASSGNGSGPHLGFELFKMMAGIDVVHVPYKGAGPANRELISGQVQAFFNNVLAARGHIAAGRIRVLAATGATRTKAMPEVPTLAESGLAGFDVTSWYSVVAPAGVPAAIVNRIQADTAAVLRLPDVVSRLSNDGAEPIGSTSGELDRFLRAEIRKWDKVVKSAGIVLN
jgi:tripartite-type tricarboxylate transporter receptor subunit TctC